MNCQISLCTFQCKSRWVDAGMVLHSFDVFMYTDTAVAVNSIQSCLLQLEFSLYYYFFPFSSLVSSSIAPKAQRTPIKRLMALLQHAIVWAAWVLTLTMTFGWQLSTPLVRAPPARWWRLAQLSRPPPRLLARSGWCLYLTKWKAVFTAIKMFFPNMDRGYFWLWDSRCWSCLSILFYSHKSFEGISNLVQAYILEWLEFVQRAIYQDLFH